jgi:alginate O-acetyltransferase complex protein AlgI
MGGWFVLLGGWVLFTVLPLVFHGTVRKTTAAVVPLLCLPVLVLWPSEGPLWRLAATSLWLLFAIKACVALRADEPARDRKALVAHLLYMTVWPGMDPERLRQRGSPEADDGVRFARGAVFVYAGLALGLALTLLRPSVPGVLVGWLGIAALLCVVHFGWSEILTSVLRLAGIRTGFLFDTPFASRSLREFWGKRWNLPFVEMDRRLLMRPLARFLGARGAVFGIFVVSGLLHELAISYSAGAGWGGPLAYFLLQAGLVQAEKRLRIQSRVWTWFWLLAPLPLLFHAPFRETFILPLFDNLHRLLISKPTLWYLDWGLWIMGVMQLMVLFASFQVPGKLRWREELPRLSPFNQKLMWTYAVFIVFTVVSFGVLTFILHEDLLQGSRGALGLAAFIALFWTLRLIVDTFYFRHEDWPPEPIFRVGHVMLNSLFTFLVVTYGGLVVWHVWGGI